MGNLDTKIKDIISKIMVNKNTTKKKQLFSKIIFLKFHFLFRFIFNCLKNNKFILKVFFSFNLLCFI